MTRHVVLLVAVVLAPSTAAAQPPRLDPGVRVRVEAPSLSKERFAGTLMAQTQDSLSIAVPPRLYNVPLAALKRLEVSSGTTYLGAALRGAAYGGATVGAIGSVYAMNSYWEGQTSADKVGIAVTAAVVGAVLGGGVGLFMGTERWTRVYP